MIRRLLVSLILTPLTLAAFLFLAPVQTDTAALDALLHRIAETQAHGISDNALGLGGWVGMLERGERLYIQCGYIADAARVLIEREGYRVRRVALFTLEPLNFCDDGHQALEVWYPGFGWRYLDFSTNRLYRQSVADFVQGRGEYVVLADDEPFEDGFAAWLKAYPCDSAITKDIETWYDRVAQSVVGVW